jgi:hypothetical protein
MALKDARRECFSRCQCDDAYYKVDELRTTSESFNAVVNKTTEDPTFFGFFSPDLEGFTALGHSIEDIFIKPDGECRNADLLMQQSLPSLRKSLAQNHYPKRKHRWLTPVRFHVVFLQF